MIENIDQQIYQALAAAGHPLAPKGLELGHKKLPSGTTENTVIALEDDPVETE